MRDITLKVNGKTHQTAVDPATPLIYVLRNELALTGAKLGCGLEQCGACAVLVDGRSQLSCAAAVETFDGKEIVTVEGLAENGSLHRVQQAFVETGAAQCGYCTPGMVIAVAGLMAANANPSDADARAALQGHLCRCGSLSRVLAAVQRLAGLEAADGG